MDKKRKLGEYPIQVWNRQLEGASAWSSHFHNHMAIEYFLVSPKPLKLLLIGAVTWAGTSSGKQIILHLAIRNLQILYNHAGISTPEENLRCEVLLSERFASIWLRIQHKLWNTEFFRHHSGSPTYQFQGI